EPSSFVLLLVVLLPRLRGRTLIHQANLSAPKLARTGRRVVFIGTAPDYLSYGPVSEHRCDTENVERENVEQASHNGRRWVSGKCKTKAGTATQNISNAL